VTLQNALCQAAWAKPGLLHMAAAAAAVPAAVEASLLQLLCWRLWQRWWLGFAAAPAVAQHQIHQCVRHGMHIVGSQVVQQWLQHALHIQHA
jgi:hypothetical protein